MVSVVIIYAKKVTQNEESNLPFRMASEALVLDAVHSDFCTCHFRVDALLHAVVFEAKTLFTKGSLGYLSSIYFSTRGGGWPFPGN